ncbi:PKD domain-containing protein [Marinilabiliaceae bacterium ANBcel2]|nr:PKD domain-containing protein [Marinilabiliaceae bacterium ANBcel2]
MVWSFTIRGIIITFFLLFGFSGVNTYGQYDVDVCGDVIFVSDLFNDDDINIPPGHQGGGNWIDLDGLSISDRAGDAYFYGIEEGETYSVVYRRNANNIYTFNLTGTSGGTFFELLNEDSNTSDVLLTEPDSYSFTVSPDDAAAYLFYKREMPNGNLQVDSHTSNSYSINIDDDEVYQLYSVATDNNGCITITNTIEISVGDLQLRVEGGESVCSDDAPDFTLYVRPFDNTNYYYTWIDEDEEEVGDGETYHVEDYGTYTVVAHTDQTLPNNSNQWSGYETVYVGDYQISNVTLEPLGVVVLCDDEIQLTGSYGNYPLMVEDDQKEVSYLWSYYNSVVERGDYLGGDQSFTAEDAGGYTFTVYETDNYLCYGISDVTRLITPDVDATLVNNGVCAPANAEIDIAVYGEANIEWEVVISDGTDNFSYTIVGDDQGAALDRVTISGEYEESVELEIISVEASGGTVSCDIEPEMLPLPFEFEVFQYPEEFLFEGEGCVGDNIEIVLEESEDDVEYFLLKDGDDQSQLSGTGGELIFNVTDAEEASYTIEARRGECVIPMLGEVLVAQPPAERDVFVTGTFCSGSSHLVEVGNPEDGVLYALYRDGEQVREPRKSGEFTGVTTAGEYSVIASRGDCFIEFTDLFIINQTPQSQTIIETEGCEGDELIVELEDSEGSDVEYTLYDPSDDVVETVTGSGESLTFNVPVSEGGIYYLIASHASSGCSVEIGEIEIFEIPDLDFELSIDGDAPYCGGVSHTIRLSGSQEEIVYRLYRNHMDGERVGITTGTGGEITFTQSEPGTYYITADNSGCEYEIDSEVVISKQPQSFSVIGDDACEGDDNVSITVEDTETDVQYMLLRDSNPYGTTIGGDGSSITFSAEYLVGTYTVLANDGGCETLMDGEVVVNSLPDVYITGALDDYCADAGEVTIEGRPRTGDNSWRIRGMTDNPSWYIDNGDHTSTIDVEEAVDHGEGTYTFIYTYTSLNTGCINSAEHDITFHDDLNDNINFRWRYDESGDDDWEDFEEGEELLICYDEGDILLEGYFIDSGDAIEAGSFSGSEGLSFYDDGVAIFDPEEAGNGLHTIIYTYIDEETGCLGEVEHEIQIGVTLSIEGDPLDYVYCWDDAVIEWYGTPEIGDPDEGLLSVYYVDENGDLSLINSKIGTDSDNRLEINPSLLDAGNYIVRYEFEDDAGCTNILDEEFVIEEEFDASFVTESGITQFCLNSGEVVLEPAPDASPFGTYYGDIPGSSAYISGNRFSPYIAGVGDHIIYREVSSGNCNAIAQLTVTVLDLPDIEVIVNDNYCEFDSPDRIELNVEDNSGDFIFRVTQFGASGRSPLFVYDSNGDPDYFDEIEVLDGATSDIYFDPQYVGPGTYRFEFEYVHPSNGCSNVIEKEVVVDPVRYVNFDDNISGDDYSYCRNIGEVLFTATFSDGSGVPEGSYSISSSSDALTNYNDGTARLDVSVMSAGEYTITYRYENINGCTSERVKSIEVLSTPSLYSVEGGGYYCSGEEGVEVLLSNSQTGVEYELYLNGNPLPVSVTEEGSGGEISFGNQTAEGAYSVMARNISTDCMQLMDGEVDIVINEVSLDFESVIPVSCYGDNNGEVEVSASGGSAPYSYYLYNSNGDLLNSNNSGRFANLSAGEYEVDVVDNIGCTIASTRGVEVTQPAAEISFNFSSSPAACGDCTIGDDCEGGAQIFDINGGTPDYDIVWHDSNGDEVAFTANNGLAIVNVPAGDYTVTVTDANGCEVSEVIEVDMVPAIYLTEVESERINVECYGSTTGEFVVVASGGAADAEYQFSIDQNNWRNPDVEGGSERTFQNLSAGTYPVYVRDRNYPRCIYELSSAVIITQPQELTISERVSEHIDVTCHNGDDGAFEVTATGGSGNYQFSVNNGAWNDSPLYQSLTAGTYLVKVRDADYSSCESSSIEIVINEPSLLTIDSYDKSNPLCYLGNDGSLSVSASGGVGNYVYQLSGEVSRDAQSSPLFENLPAGTYSVTVFDENGCSYQYSNIILEQPSSELSVGLVEENPVSCRGAGDGSFTIRASGGSGDYRFSVDDGDNWYDNGTPQYSYEDLSAGVYEVLVEDINGCSSSIEIEVIEPDSDFVLSGSVESHVTCYQGEDGAISVTGGGGASDNGVIYRLYQFENSDWVWKSSAHYTDLQSHLFDNLNAGSYLVRGFDDNGCSDEIEFEIDQPDSQIVIDVETINHVSTPGGSDGSISISVTGGVTDEGSYSEIIWEGENLNGDDISDELTSGVFQQVGLEAGNYSVEVIDLNGCSHAYNNIVVNEPGQPLGLNIDITHPGPCYGEENGRISLSALGGVPAYSIVLYRGGVEVAKTGSGEGYAYYEGLPAGTYIAQIADASDNPVVTETIELITPDGVELNFTKEGDVTCYGESNGVVSFSASGGVPFDDNGTHYYSYNIVPLNGGPGFNGEISPGESVTINSLVVGEYEIYVEDEKGCTQSQEFVIDQPLELGVDVINRSDISCYGDSNGEILISVTGRPGGTLFEYEWEKLVEGGSVNSDADWQSYSGSENSRELNDLSSGIYRVIAQEVGAGCIVLSAPIYIEEPSELELTIDSKRNVTTCFGGDNGEVRLDITGGVPPYQVDYGTVSFDWSGGGLAVADNLTEGYYTFTVTDANGCSSSIEDLYISQPGEILVSDFEYAMGCDPLSGRISMSVEGGLLDSDDNYNYIIRVVNTTNNQTYSQFYSYSSTQESIDVLIENLPRGHYNITIEDQNSSDPALCTPEFDFELVPLTVEAAVMHATCSGVDDGSISLTVYGGSGEYEFDWDGVDGFSADSRDVSELSAGEYSVTVTDVVEGCELDYIYSVANDFSLDVTASVDKDASCYGESDGIVSAVAVGGEGDYEYRWSTFDNTSGEWESLATGSVIDNLSSGRYRVKAVDINGCAVLSDEIELLSPEDFSAEEQEEFTSNVSCNGGSDGHFRVLPSDGRDYEYSIDGGLTWQGSRRFDGLSAGSYLVSVRESDTGCYKLDLFDVLIEEPEVFEITDIEIIDVDCRGSFNGSAHIFVAGGASSEGADFLLFRENSNSAWVYYDGVIDNSNGNYLFEELQFGEYKIEVKDANGCVTEQEFAVSQPDELTVDIDVTHLSLHDSSDGVISVNNISGQNAPYNVTLTYPDPDNPSESITTTEHSLLYEGLISGEYIVHIESSGENCVDDFAVTITEPGELAVDFGYDDVSCYGGDDGRITVSIARSDGPPYTIDWEGNLSTGDVVNGSETVSDSNFEIASLISGTYTVLVSDAAGHEVEHVITIDEPLSFEVDLVVDDHISCYGAGDGVIQLRSYTDRDQSEINQYEVIWSGPQFSREGLLGEDNIVTLENLSNSGSYNVKVTDNNGCIYRSSITLNEPEELDILVSEKRHVSCNGGDNGYITVNVEGRPEGTIFYYEWEEYDSENEEWNVITEEDQHTINNIEAGVYRVTASEHNTLCEITSGDIVIGEPNQLSINTEVYNISTCYGDNSGEIVITANGGTTPYNIVWSSTGGVNSWNGSSLRISDLTAGDYTFELQDYNDCIITHTVTVTEPGEMVVSDITHSIGCEEGDLGQLSFNILGGRAVEDFYHYRVSLLHESGTEYGYTVSPFDPSVNPGEREVYIDGLPEGLYNLKVTDLNSTSSTKCLFEYQFELENIDVSETILHPVCPGSNDGSINLQITGGSGNYSYSWSREGDPGYSASTRDISGLRSGVYTLLLEDVERGCTNEYSYILNESRRLIINGTVNDITCYGEDNGSIIINEVENALSNVEYYWNGSTEAGEDRISGLSPGTYSLEVIDEDGCSAAKTFTVNEPDRIEFYFESHLECDDQYNRSVQLSGLSGGVEPYTFNWSGAGEFDISDDQLTIDNISRSGEYGVQIIDDNGCSVRENISVYGDINVDVSVTDVTCAGGNGGRVVLEITGGSGSYSYDWIGDNGFNASTRDITNVEAGIYEVVITDNNQYCEDSDQFYSVEYEVEVREPAPLIISGVTSNIECYGDNNGSIELDVNGGSGLYDYHWTTTNGSGIQQGVGDQSKLTGGSYNVRVADERGCINEETFVIDEPEELTFELEINDTNCDGENSIEILNAGGGTGDYKFNWDGPGAGEVSGDDIRTDLPGGEYTVTMIDVGTTRNCYVERSVSLVKPLEVEYVASHPLCEGSNDGAIELTPVNGVAPYSYEWSSDDGSGLITDSRNQSGLSPGVYTVTLTDSNSKGDPGCSYELEIELEPIHKIEVDKSITDVRCFGGHNGAISLTVAGGSGNYIYSWNGPDGFTSSDKSVDNLVAGSYTVTITDDELSSCSVTRSFTVNQPDDGVVVTDVNIEEVLCRGEATGSIGIDIEGGTEPYSFNWTGPANLMSPDAQNIDGLVAGDYYLVITDGNSCQYNFGPYNVPEPDEELLIESYDVEHVAVTGESSGSISIVVSGGSGSYQIEWSVFDNDLDDYDLLEEQSNSTVASDLPAGLYRVEVFDGNGCFTAIENIIVDQPGEELSMFIEKLNAGACRNSSNGKIDVTVSGGTLPYTSLTLYKGTEVVEEVINSNRLTVSELNAGDYEVVAVDANGSEVRDDVTILQPDKLNLAITDRVDVDCYESLTGSITLSAGGGVPVDNKEYYIALLGGPAQTGSYEHISPNEDFTFDNLPAGSYIVRLIDDSNVKRVKGDNNSFEEGYGDGTYNIYNDCFIEKEVVINQPEAEVNITVQPDDQYVCEGEKPLLNISVRGWTIDPDDESTHLDVTLNDGNSYRVDNSSYFFEPQDYPVNSITKYSVAEVRAADSDCLKGYGTGEATVIMNPLPTASVYGDGRMCYGDSRNIGFDLTGNGPWTIIYSDGTNEYTITDITSSPYILEVSPEESTSYELVEVSDSYCRGTVSGSAEIIVEPLTTVELTGGDSDPVICRGDETHLRFHFSSLDGAPWRIYYEEVVDINGNEVVEEKSRTVSEDMLTQDEDYFEFVVSPSITTTYRITSIVDSNAGEINCDGVVQGSEVKVLVNQLPVYPSEIYGEERACQTSQVEYYVDEINYATGYIWEVPFGAEVVQGNGTRNITVEFSEEAESGYISVYGTNGCGAGPVRRIYINVDKLPQDIGEIVGETDLCAGSTRVPYYIDPLPDASGYNWELPNGFTVDGNGGNYILVDIDPQLDQYSGIIKVTPYNECGESIESAEIEVTIHPNPIADAGLNQNVCETDAVLNARTDHHESSWSGEWSVIPGFGSAIIEDNEDPSSVVSNLSRGDVHFQWKVTTDNGCVDFDEVVIRNNTLPVNASVESDVVCDGSVVVTGTSLPDFDNVTGEWSAVYPESSAVSFESATTAETDVHDLYPGLNRLRWTITQNGCDSYAEVEVVNNQVDEATIEGPALVDLCSDEITLRANVPEEGSGRWSIVKGYGNISDRDDAEIDITDISRGENIFRWTISKGGCSSYSEVVVRNNIVEVDAGRDDVVCDNFVTLEGSALDGSTTGYWSLIDGGGSFVDGGDPNTLVTELDRGDNIFEWSVTKYGCTTSDQVTITNDTPSTASVGSDLDLCSFETELSANTPDVGSGRWSVVSGSARFAERDNPETFVDRLGHGENILRWTITNGACTSKADLVVNNRHVEVDAGDDFVSCSRTVTLNGSEVPEGMEGEWRVLQGEGGATIPSGSEGNSELTVGGVDYGLNGFVWTINYDGCESSDIVYVTNDMPASISGNDIVPVDAGPNQNIASQVTNMQALPLYQGEGEWMLISGGADIVDPSDPRTAVENIRRGENTFRWIVTNGDCSVTETVVITNGEVIAANAGADESVCENFVRLNGNDPDVALGEWTVVQGSATFDDPHDPRTWARNLGPDENILRWTIHSANTSSSDEVVITNNQPDQARAGYDDAVCETWFDLEGNIPGHNLGTGEWSLYSGGGEFVDSSDPNTRVENMAYGENRYIYTITKEGCLTSDTVTIINGTPTEAIAGEDVEICTDEFRLQPNVPTYGEASWRIGSVGNARFEGNRVYDLAPGRNELIYEISTDYCSSQDVITIVNNEPSEAYAGRERRVCTDEVYLNATIPELGEGSWERINAGEIEDITDPNTFVTGLTRGPNHFRWTVDNDGCLSVDEVIIYYDMIDAYAGEDDLICSDTYELEANNPLPGEGTWGVVGGSGSAQFEDPNDPYTTVTNLDRGENILTWTINHGECTSVATVTIINDSPDTPDAGSNRNRCDDYIVLEGNVPEFGQGSWTIRNGGGDFSSNIYPDSPENDPAARVDNLRFGSNIFRWTIETENCVAYDDVEIRYSTIEANAGGDEWVVCDNEAELEANNPGPGRGSWSVPGGEGSANFVNSSDPGTTVTNLRRGTNRLRWTITHDGCTTHDDIVVINNLPSSAYAGNNDQVCSDEITLDASEPEIGSGQWEISSGSAEFVDGADVAKTQVRNLEKGENIFVWRTTSDDGMCSLEDEVIIRNDEPSDAYAGADYEEVCESQFSLKAATPDYGTGSWSIIEGGGNFDDTENPRATISSLDHGRNILRWTVSEGRCSKSADIELINNTPTRANAGPDIEDCKNYHTLDANVPGYYDDARWERVSGYGEFADINDPKTEVTDLGFGENVFRWTITKGSCSTSDVVSIYNMVPDQAFAGSDQTDVCQTYTVLNANDPESGEGSWEVVKGKGRFEDSSQYNTVVRDLGFGENIFRWKVSYGECSTEDEVVVINKHTDVYAGEDQIVYEPEALLNANNAGDLDATWKIVGDSPAQFEDERFFNTRVHNLYEGINTFQWEIDVDGCVVSDQVSIEYRRVPDAGFITDRDEGCYPLEVSFTNYSEGGSQFLWDFGDGNTSGDRNPVHTFEEPGVYDVRLVAPGPDGRDGVYTRPVTVHGHPVADFTVNPEVVYVPGENVRFYDLSTDAVSWEWNFGDGSFSVERNPEHAYQNEGIYDIELIVSSEQECVDTLVVENLIEARPQGFVKFPNAFKPRPGGAEGAVDPSSEYVVVFKPAFKDVDEFKLEIFNRWGQKIFETDDIENGWDGRYEGDLAPQAVYVYMVSGRYINGREFRKTGTVMLVR